MRVMVTADDSFRTWLARSLGLCVIVDAWVLGAVIWFAVWCRATVT